MRRYPVFLFSLPVAAACLGLGVWQLSRLRQRRVLNEQARASMVERTLSGRFDYGRQVIIEGRFLNGIPAVIIVTPLLLSDGTAVLVERGWVPSPDAHTVDLESLEEGEFAEVRGIPVDPGPIVPAPRDSWPKRVQRATPKSLAIAYPYRLRTELLRRTNAAPQLRAVPLPELNDGPHLGYAIQWFSFAIIVIVGSVFLNRGEKGKGKRET